MPRRLGWTSALLATLSCAAPAPSPAAPAAADASAPGAFLVERVSSAVPFPRGLVIVNGKLCVLARGRSREFGGASGAVDDRAGTIFEVDPRIAEPIDEVVVGEAIRHNAKVLAQPTAPPFIFFDRSANPPTRDRSTDRPYCTLRFDPLTHSFYLCGFSGIDGLETDKINFTKNLSDMVMRYDLRTARWYEVERHESAAGGLYPHNDPTRSPPPHGWLNGPDNCLVVGRSLYCVAKDNSRLVHYDLTEIAADPEAGPPKSRVVFADEIAVEGLGSRRFFGHSALAAGDGWLYVGFRTSSEIIRVPLDDDGLVKQPVRAQLVATFDPYDPATRKSANITDIDLGEDGLLYVLSAKPTRVYRFRPDPAQVYDARGENAKSPWLDLAKLANKPELKSENILLDESGRIYVSASDAYSADSEVSSVIYRATPIAAEWAAAKS